MTDPLTKEERSLRMSRVRQKDTDLEQLVRSSLHRRGQRFRKNVRSLPGSPDVVFTKAKVAVFIDGDFWHGWKFEEKKGRYKPYWKQKIAENIDRDERNFATLREMGWVVIRVWQHDIKTDLPGITEKIVSAVTRRRGSLGEMISHPCKGRLVLVQIAPYGKRTPTSNRELSVRQR